MDNNISIQAFIDDFNIINVYILKSFYNGEAKDFYISDNDKLISKCTLISKDEDNLFIKYKLSFVFDIIIGNDYYISCNHGFLTYLQYRYIVKTKKFEKLFYYDGKLGSYYHKDKTEFYLWAPTSNYVILKLDNKCYYMDKKNGVYKKVVYGDFEKSLYTYLVSVNGKVKEVSDPYALSSNSNSKKSAVINFKKDKKIKLKKYEKYTDTIIYECSIKDLTNEGTFKSLLNSNRIEYIKNLGITHVQFMPIFDFYTIDENNKENAYNWGYDPIQYFSLEGSYSDNPNNPYDRIIYFKQLINKLHENNIKVNIDIVFNHIYDPIFTNFTNIVPYYYLRYDEKHNLSNGSFCGNDLDSKMKMVKKLFIDNIKMWINLYDIDGFRFDLMGILDINTINQIYDECKKYKEDLMIYGEGWNMPTYLLDSEKSIIENSDKMSNIAFFNDYFRDSLKGKTSDDAIYDKGYLTGNCLMVYEVMSSLSGNSKDNLYKRFINPTQSINYIEAHDNLTLFDKINICCSNESDEVKVLRQKLHIACILFSQGVPFLHCGIEFLRSKNYKSNTYNDNTGNNYINFNNLNEDVINYTKDCIILRKKYEEFRLSTTKEINKYVSFEIKDNVIVEYNIKNIKVIINPTEFYRNYTYDNKFKVIFDEKGIANSTISTNVTISPFTLKIIKFENEIQL